MSVFISRCAALGGTQLASVRGFEFGPDKIAEAVRAFGHNYSPPYDDRLYVLRHHRSDLIVRLERRTTDAPPAGHVMTPNERHWERVIGPYVDTVAIDQDHLDNIIRRLQTSERKNAGWVAKSKDGEWTQMPASEIKMILQKLGHSKTEAEQIMGHCALSPWKLVSLPFQPEYPGGRRWNISAPQYRYQPVPGAHPHWTRILSHIARDLDPLLPTIGWAREAGIRTGADYLQAIFASILRYPCEPTPYLFLFGPENSGKSILHESFELLVTSGVVKADRALTSQSDFNGELAGAILCVVEEKDIGRTPGAYQKIKDCVTSPKLSIRRMYTDTFTISNTTHWIQCANTMAACPRQMGDTRIQCFYVPELAPGQEIPKSVLKEKLVEEAPHFMQTLMDMRLPQPDGRLRVPLVETESARRVAERSADDRLMRLIDFVGGHQHWQGTAPELADAVGTPRDFRSLRRFFDDHRFALASRKITFDFSEMESRHKGARRITLRAA